MGFLLGLLAARTFSDNATRGQSVASGGGGRRHGGGGVPAPRMVAGQQTGEQARPSLASYKRLQRDPGLLQRKRGGAALLEEFEAAPWLLPPRTEALPHAGVHDFDALLQLRARPQGSHPSAVALFLFTADWAIIAQNSARRRAQLHASGLLLEPVGKGKKPTAHDFVVMSWIKPTVVLRALRQGHAVMVADADIAYAVKPLWASYLAYNEQAQADGAWLEEKPTSNAGHFVLLCTPASLSFAKAWVASAERAIEEGLTDQKVLPQLEEGSYLRCNTLCRCLHTDYNLTEQGQRQQVAVLRTYLPSHFVYSPNWCTIGSPDWVPAIDPCDWSVLYLHIICVSAAADKAAVLRAAGFWFMDDGEGGQASGLRRVPAAARRSQRRARLPPAALAVA
ncbi:hypothetical protein C2E20_4221 [Micractinium conductrix]|uniref:Nucleotide-diphospho-sugar transferase domain-containing protein n=1 Tax=Micractinium conductrix TaxID=554055 RepID=A0A2P6VEK6_9CHLO|nr:hypothetical protein C2E20_4221 [Micractinium conductrix]|eukprot:PSC72525.1 hypothetical protein C2E20_4221 [Micractinium conductrix]